MKSQTGARDIDDDPTLRTDALGTASAAAIVWRFELYEPTRTELSSDVLSSLRLITPPAPRQVWSRPRVVALPASVASLHPRPTRTTDASFLLATVLAMVTGAAGRLVAVGRKHAISFARTLSLLTAECVARVRRKVVEVHFLRPLRARWNAGARAGVRSWRAVDMNSLLRRQ